MSEAYFARLIGAQQGACHFVGDPSSVYQVAAAIAADGGGRYAGKYDNPGWLASQGLDPEPYTTQLRALLAFPAREPDQEST